MSEELLPYYNRELAYLRRLGAEFAEAHPKIAGRLRLSADTVEDPHVSRLVESVAFLNARIRKKLDDEFPELTDALLSVLYPHFLAPVPSMAIGQFECDPELTAGYAIPRGTMLETDRIDGEPCRFRTCYPVTALPVRVDAARLSGAPFTAPATPRSAACAGVLRIALRCATDNGSFAVLKPRSLRFFLKGQEQHVYALHELLFNNVVEVAVATSVKDKSPQLLPPSCLKPVGFERDQGLLPYPDRSFAGYRLLSEFFAFPAKFLFVDVEGIAPKKLADAGSSLELYVYLNRTTTDLEQNVSTDTFALGCTPVVNLFRKRAEPVRLSQADSEYRVLADARRPRAVEVYSVDRVTATTPGGEIVRYFPFYGLDHGGGDERARAWWYASRRPAPPSTDKQDKGTEVWLSLVDLGFQPSAPAGWVLDIETTCLNRDLPARLPVGPKLRFSEGGGPIKSIRCLTNPTRTLRPPQGAGAMWRLVSHLSLNHLSIAGGEEATQALREVLRLYDISGSRENQAVIEGLLSVKSRDASLRVHSGGRPGFCRGTEVVVHLDEARFAGSGAFLFGCVLDRFLALYATVNTFVQLAVTTDLRQGELHRWPPRAGDRPLL